MNPFKRAKRRYKLLANEGGQMAVFIALIFQVLFVFFAMVVNVGLIVHDKINLQSSVDLAAYYAAAKQAEQLNEIAHINYQIRQDYKLLAWRLRVLGNFGRAAHPVAKAYPNQVQPDTGITGSAEEQKQFAEQPSVCITHGGWMETRVLSTGTAENLCRQKPGVGTIPILSAPPVIFPSPGNFLINAQLEDFRQRFQNRCKDAGPLNWQFTALMNFGYRRAVMIRKDMIKSIATNLSAPLEASQGAFQDRAGDAVATGMEATLRKNLTKANKETVVSIEGFNGLSDPRCMEQSYEGMPMWLREIQIFPTITFTDFWGSSGGCDPQVSSLENPRDPARLSGFDPGGVLQQLTKGEPMPNTNYHSSRGFEKNPWCMAYVGVKAETAPRKPFAPFGGAIKLTARAFAMPFGGRIGPWDKATWPMNAEMSTGAEVDPLAAPRQTPDQFVNRADPRNIPNYSRYPGDTLGLKSQLAMSATMPSLIAPTFPPTTRIYTLGHYSHFAKVDQHGDLLPYNSQNPNDVSPLRAIETAAVAPDLFDTTYYSVEPNYYGYYFKDLNRNRFRSTTPIADLGNRKDNPLFQKYSVRDQISGVYVNGGDSGQVLVEGLYWMIRKPEHLLTAWSPKAPQDFTFPDQFGKCMQNGKPANEEPATVGDCIAGGRTGYSVQLVSRDYLTSNRHSLGGSGESPGSIKNPPKADY